MMAKRKMSLNELSDKVGITLANLSILKNNKAKAIRFSTLDAICKALDCKVEDIIEYVEAQNKHILFSLNNGTTIESTEPLRFHENHLTMEDGFFRCHRSYIINICQIDTFTLKEVTMRSGKRSPISRSCHKEFEAAYFAITFGKAGEEH